MAHSYLLLAEESGRHNAGIVQHLATILFGFGLSCVMIYAAGGEPMAVMLPSDNMATQFTRPAQRRLLQPLTRMASQFTQPAQRQFLRPLARRPRSKRNDWLESEATIGIRNGIVDLGSLVATTLGPKGMNVLIPEKNGPLIVSKGSTISKAVHDSAEMSPEGLGAELADESASSVDGTVGDGTTSTIVLTAATLHARNLLQEPDNSRLVAIDSPTALGAVMSTTMNKKDLKKQRSLNPEDTIPQAATKLMWLNKPSSTSYVLLSGVAPSTSRLLESIANSNAGLPSKLFAEALIKASNFIYSLQIARWGSPFALGVLHSDRTRTVVENTAENSASLARRTLEIIFPREPEGTSETTR